MNCSRERTWQSNFDQRPKCDLVYSFGLFDYLPDHLLLQVAKNAMHCLADSGTFVFCLKDSRYYDALFYELFYDWRFVSRIRDDGFALASDLGLTVRQTFDVEGRAITIFVCTR